MVSPSRNYQSEKEGKARRLAQRLMGSDGSAQWPERAVYDFLRTRGYEWQGVEWYPANDGLVQFDAVPGDWFD